MDGPFYLDLRQPFITADVPAVTLATTNKALYTAAFFPVLGSNYWGFPGKRLKIRLFGRITTAATPGNFTAGVYWGSGADATGTLLASTTAQALTASQTNLSWMCEVNVHCRALGSSGSLFVDGYFKFNEGVVAPMIMLPGSAPAATTADLTTASIISIQAARSGSTAETMQVHDIEVVPMN